MLHIHCGDSSADCLRQSDVAGEVVVWCDPVVEGPTPAGLSSTAWLDARAIYLEDATAGGLPRHKARHWLEQQNADRERWRDHEEVVLWFDACMFDQSILVCQLDWFSRQELGETKLSLICVGEFPGFERFTGLGELLPHQLASLLPQRVPVTVEHLELGRRAWEAWRAPNPRCLETLIADDLEALPYLREALIRHLQEFPSTHNGLGRLESLILAGIADGATTLGTLFRWINEQEPRPYLGDTSLWSCVNSLAQPPHALVSLPDGEALTPWDPPAGTGRRPVDLTALGREVLAGNHDYVALHGLNRWVGGVHLKGHQAAWRWNLPGDAAEDVTGSHPLLLVR